MRSLKNAVAGVSILVIPALIEYPVTHAPAASALETAAPREILMARLADAVLAAQGGASGAVGRMPALIGLAIVLMLSLWLAFRRRPAAKPERPPRSHRASVALELIQCGSGSDDVMVRAHVSRDAVELLRHTTVGQSLN